MRLLFFILFIMFAIIVGLSTMYASILITIVSFLAGAIVLRFVGMRSGII